MDQDTLGKIHPTDWERRGSNSGPLSTRQVTYPLHHGGLRFVAVTLKPIGFIFCGLMSGAPEGSTGSGSGLTRLRRQGNG